MARLKVPESKFLKVKCNDCGSEQVVFGNSASDVICLVCGKLLAKSTGGKINLLAKFVKVLD
jgi:small subunit ribosomal protein S27e